MAKAPDKPRWSGKKRRAAKKARSGTKRRVAKARSADKARDSSDSSQIADDVQDEAALELSTANNAPRTPSGAATKARRGAAKSRVAAKALRHTQQRRRARDAAWSQPIPTPSAHREGERRTRSAGDTRRALSQIGGVTHATGPPGEATQLAKRILLDAGEPAENLPHVHGFHSYPGRMHPALAASAIARLSKPGDVVLDPFCGSATVLVEAVLTARQAWGFDVNPLAIELGWLKTQVLTERLREQLEAALQRVVVSAEERRAEKRGPTRRYPAEDLSWFAIHVLLELDGLKAAIRKERNPWVRRVLLLVLSSLLTKLSRRSADSTNERVEKRLASGFAIKSFDRKTRELVKRWNSFSGQLPTAPRVRLGIDDARQLREVEERSVDLVVTSPPYAGVFDYVEHHRLRLRWLDLDLDDFNRRELGARRALGRDGRARALERWQRELHQVLTNLRRVLKPGGRIAWLMADSAVEGSAVFAEDVLHAVGPRAGLTILGAAAQKRPSFSARERDAFKHRLRQEHLFLLGASGRHGRGQTRRE